MASHTPAASAARDSHAARDAEQEFKPKAADHGAGSGATALTTTTAPTPTPSRPKSCSASSPRCSC